uniref:Astacin domain-containing protein n=1 Tax=Meloidogyne hapla TaxID=6305 RepID=A0A1I8BGG3_MELHA
MPFKVFPSIWIFLFIQLFIFNVKLSPIDPRRRLIRQNGINIERRSDLNRVENLNKEVENYTNSPPHCTRATVTFTQGSKCRVTPYIRALDIMALWNCEWNMSYYR